MANLLEETHPKAASAIRADTAYIVTSLLQGVVQRGTAARAARLGRPWRVRPEPPTTIRTRGFIGFDPGLAAGVWVGFDEKRSLGEKEVGARTALPAWIGFMSEVRENQPVEDFFRSLEHRLCSGGSAHRLPEPQFGQRRDFGGLHFWHRASGVSLSMGPPNKRVALTTPSQAPVRRWHRASGGILDMSCHK